MATESKDEDEPVHNSSNEAFVHYWPKRTYNSNFWRFTSTSNWNKSQIQSFLMDKNFYYPQSASESYLRCLHHRAEKGLLSYDGCTVEDLQTFCAQRGLKVSTASRKREDLHTALVTADRRYPAFKRFLDLSAEIRDLIYEYHFRSFDTRNRPLVTTAAPPITAVSSVIRRESLPAFYDVCVFEFRMDVAPEGPTISGPASRILASWSDPNLPRIRNLSISVTPQESPAPHYCPITRVRTPTWLLEVGTAVAHTRTTYREMTEDLHPGFTQDWCLHFCEMFDDAFREFTRRIVLRDADNRPTRQDLMHLIASVQQTYWRESCRRRDAHIPSTDRIIIDIERQVAEWTELFDMMRDDATASVISE